MHSRKAVRKKVIGLRQGLGAGIVAASLLLSFLLVSCGNDQSTAVSGTQTNRNIPASQVTVQPPAQPVTGTGATQNSNNVDVIIAKSDIPVGSEISGGQLATAAKPRSEIDPNQDIIDPREAIGRITKVKYNAGQQVKKGDLVEGTFSNYMNQLVKDRKLEPGKKAYAYATNDLASVAGLIRENDLVDVVATYMIERRSATVPSTAPGGATAELTTKTVLQNIRVLRVLRLQPTAQQQVERPTPTPNPDTPTAAVVAGPATPTPTPTLPPLTESGSGFVVNTILVLAVTDQEAEILKFTREYRVSNTVARFTTSPVLIDGTGNTDRTFFGDIAPGGVAVVNFVLRPRPQDPSNLTDPALVRETTSGVTFRVLIRDYGLPIPELVYATGTQ